MAAAVVEGGGTGEWKLQAGEKSRCCGDGSARGGWEWEETQRERERQREMVFLVHQKVSDLSDIKRDVHT